MSVAGLRNIGPKSAAWLRQVGVRSQQDLIDLGAVDAFLKVRRAGFKPSLNLLYSLQGALLDCHWQALTEAQRQQLQQALDTAAAQLPDPRARAAGGPVSTYRVQDDAEDGDGDNDIADDDAHARDD